MKRITKLLLALLLAISLPQAAQAQGWTRTIDNQPGETAVSMSATANGHVMASPASGGYYLMEVDTLGHEIWHQTYTTPHNVSIRKIATLSNGDIVLMGIISSGSSAPGNVYVTKHSPTGARFWFKEYYQVNAGSNGYDLLVMPADTLILAGHIYNTTLTPNEVEAALFKLDSNGDSIHLEVYHDADTFGTELSQIVLGPGNTIVATGKTGLESSNVIMIGYDAGLTQLWLEYTVLGGANEVIIPRGLCATSDGGYLSTGYNFVTGGPNGIEGFAYLFKTSSTGVYQWNKKFHLSGDLSNGQAVLERSPGKYVLLAEGLVNTGGSTYYGGKPYLVFVDANGNEEFHKVYSGSTIVSIVNANDIKQLADKGFLMCGSIGQGAADVDVYLIRTDSLGNLYKAVIAGNVFGDSNENCVADGGEPNLKNWVVTATGVDSFYGVTDAFGNYTIECDTGTYALKTLLPSAYWVDTLCSDSLTAIILPSTDTLTKNLPIGKIIDCPALQVSIDAPFLRRCLPGPAYVVNYCNNGTEAATNAYVVIDLEGDLVLDSASITYISLGNNSYRFDIGTVGISDCDKFLMYIRADCGITVFGQSHCVDANIFPNTNCAPPNPLWDGARLDLTTDCQADSLAFMLINNGNTMATPRSFTIIQDDVMYVQGGVPPLLNGETFIRKVPSNGATWTFIVEQTPFFPGNKHLVESVEGCGQNNDGLFSLGYLVQYPQTGPDPSSATLCLIDRGSYDPNDKASEPKGLGLEGAIDSNWHLNYRVRFQNTGNDTAFLVIVLDTLSENLDLLSIRNVRSSHPMQMSILPGRILQFVYTNILLPDSNVNEPASHGFVSFEIDLVEGLPVGTEITNTAYIYFDQNPVVVTNTTLNTIGQLYKNWLNVTDISNPGNKVSFYPNPTQGLLNFTIDGLTESSVEVSVFNIQGQQLLQQQYSPSEQNLQLDMGHLHTGIYLLQVTGSYVGTYRVVVTH